MPEPTGQESKHIAELKSSLKITQSFLELVNRLETLPNMAKVSYDRTRSLYHAVSKDRDMETIGKELQSFFGDPIKPAGKPLPIKMRMNPSVKYLYGIRDDQSFYVKRIRNGFYYGALWPWQKIKGNITVHLGYCGNKMSEKDYQELEKLVKSKTINEKLFEQLGSEESQVYGIQLPSFLYMALIEKINCTLEISASGAVGHLHLRDGELIAAQAGNLKNRGAAYEILSWDNARIEIQEAAGGDENLINQSLTEIFSEALRIRKDQKDGKGIPSVAAQVAVSSAAPRERYQDLRAASRPSLLRRILPAVGIGLGISCLLIVAAFFYLRHLEVRGIESEYEEMLALVEETESEDEKLMLLEEFILNRQDSVFAEDAQEMIEQVQNEFEDRTYQEVLSDVERLPVDDNYELAAAAIYKRYLERYPEGVYSNEIYDKLVDIADVVDDAEYQRIVNTVYSDFVVRIEAYLGYLRKYPNGRNQSKIEALLSEVAEEYYLFIEKSLPGCNQQQQWNRCIQMCDHFLNYFSNHPRMVEIRKHKQSLLEQEEYKTLLVQVDNTGEDYQKAKQLYTAFLDQYPNTEHYRSIQRQLKAIETQLRRIKEWNEVYSFANNDDYQLVDRIAILDRYVRQNPAGFNVDKARRMLAQLQATMNAMQRRQAAAARQKEQAALQRQRDRITKERQLAQALIARVSHRYVNNGNGTVTDAQTGLMWSLLDTLMESGRCMDYDSTRSYVANLSTGGYRDWRLPTASELAKIYKSPPYFQPRGADWYWTAESFVRGYHEEVLVVTTKQERLFRSNFKGVNQCGATRAVRQP